MRVPRVEHWCPVDGCGWSYTPVPCAVNAAAYGTLDDAIAAIVRTEAATTEQVLRDHLESHDVVDFARTIKGLREQLRAATTPD